MAGEKNVETTGLLGWVDARFPASSTWKAHLSEYYAPKNFNFWYFFGSLALLVLVIQIVTGIFLVMHYKPDAERAFQSVEYIMREVPWGWLVRYMHSTGASMFFVVVYLHMLRGLFYGSYRKPRELVWIFGVAIFLCLMAEAFMGYLLPWGQMSYWGAQVIVNLFAAIPVIGPDLALLIRGDYVVSDATLNRFFSFHVIAVPLVLLGLVAAHLIALHEVGSNNPDGVEIKAHKDENGKPLDGIPFHPYYTVHDLFGVSIFLMIFSAIVFFAPEMGGYFLEYNNFIPADALKTPPHIAPVWYFTPFYSMLRAVTSEFANVLSVLALIAAMQMLLASHATSRSRLLVGVAAAVIGIVLIMFAPLDVFQPVIQVLAALAILAAVFLGWRRSVSRPVVAAVIALSGLAALLQVFDAKFFGVVMMGGAVVILFFLPWLDHSPVRSIRYRPGWHKVLYGIFMINFLVLGYLGTQAPTDVYNVMSQIGTLIYLAFFLLMPIWSRLGTFKTPPERITFAAH